MITEEIMAKETKRTYPSFREVPKRNQREYTAPTKLLGDDGKLLASGWARHNVFDYDRTKTHPQMRAKEWDFYQVCDGETMVQISCANISIGGYCSMSVVDLKTGKADTSMSLFLGGKNKVILPAKGDVPNYFEYKKGKFHAVFDTKETTRTLYFEGPLKGKTFKAEFKMDIPAGLENITTVLPFKKEGKDQSTRYFMTTKQNCMPTEGNITLDGKVVKSFTKDNTFCVLDWGRVCTPYKMVWYWGNGSTYLTDADGSKHLFGFEITWGIGDESNGTETAIFYDGKLHKFGSVDVKVFPKPDKFSDPWVFESEDGRFNLTMTPFYDHHTDTNALVARMHAHQVHGLWNGTVVLDDGKVLEIKNMYAFCEYVENRW